MSARRGTWVNGKRKLTGKWEWFWHSQRFVIWLDQKDRVTGLNKRVVTEGSERGKPEWGNWKLCDAELAERASLKLAAWNGREA